MPETIFEKKNKHNSFTQKTYARKITSNVWTRMEASVEHKKETEKLLARKKEEAASGRVPVPKEEAASWPRVPRLLPNNGTLRRRSAVFWARFVRSWASEVRHCVRSAAASGGDVMSWKKGCPGGLGALEFVRDPEEEEGEKARRERGPGGV